MIGHGGFWRVVSSTCQIRGSGISRGFTTRRAELVGDLGFGRKFNAETPVVSATPEHRPVLYRPWAESRKPPPSLGILVDHFF